MTNKTETAIQELDLQHLDQVVGGETVDPGFDGRDVLIGGLGADQMAGGGGDDILIGGTTAFDAASSGYIRVKKLNTGG